MYENLSVFDIEADSLDATYIHVLSINYKLKGKIKSTSNYEDIAKIVTREDVTLIGHNIYRFDIPTIERLVGVENKCKLVDTLFISWYLFPEKKIHGLEEWGEYFGVPKPVIKDWVGLSVEEYTHRCEEDVKINTLLWEMCWNRLIELYGEPEKAWALIDYLMYKAECAVEQEKCRWKLDEERCNLELDKLRDEYEARIKALCECMPKVPVYTTKTPPKKMYSKVTGQLTALGRKWVELCREQGKQDDWPFAITYLSGYNEGNPRSVPQLKDWLFSLGWEPDVFKFNRDKDTNEFNKVPQINKSKLDGGGLTDSVKELYEKEPNLAHLDGMFVAGHRIGVLEGFLRDKDAEGYLRARVKGLTNTLRFKHTELANLPKEDRIRGCLIAPEGYELCGSDMCSLDFRGHYIVICNAKGLNCWKAKWISHMPISS